MKTSEKVFEYLKEQGFCPKIDDDGDIIFKYQMCNFCLIGDDDDENFFGLVLPEIFEVTDDNRIAVLEAVNELNRKIKVVKAYIPKDSVWLSTEIPLDSNPEFDDFVPRVLRTMLHTYIRFYELIE